MASYLVQGLTTLYRMTQAGVATALSLPTGATLYGASTPSRGAQLDKYLVLVNGATRDLYVDALDAVRALQLEPPASVMTVAASGAGSITGDMKFACSFIIKDENGAVLQESALGPITTTTFTNNAAATITGIPISTRSEVSARRLYRSVAGGTVLFDWIDVEGNTATTIAITAGSTISIDDRYLRDGTNTIENPPDLKLVVAWKDRLFGVPRLWPDEHWWTEEHQFYNWPIENSLVVPSKQTDTYGVVGYVPRRDVLGIGRRDSFHAFAGESHDTFARQQISDIGLVSQESVVVVRDVGYFLGINAGRYIVCAWDDEGIRPISETQVDGWLNSSTYFNETYFPSCVGRYNVDTDAVEFAFAAAGTSVLNRYVSFHLRERIWYGPHITAALTLSAAGTDNRRAGVLSSGTTKLSVWGGTDGRLYKRDSTAENDHTSAVDFDVDTPFFVGASPDWNHIWGQSTLLTRAQSAGTLTITPKVGDLSAPAEAPISYALTQERELLPRWGFGRLLQLNFRHNTVDEGCKIFGIKIPFTIKGRR